MKWNSRITSQHFLINFLIASVVLPKQTVDASCDLDCYGDSLCIAGPASFDEHVKNPDGTELDIHKAKEVNGNHCECPYGWTGVLCDRMYSSCDHNHKCYNGGECIPGLTDFYDHEQLFCDCTNAKDENDISYVGKFCEKPSAVQCGAPGVFCAHGGECPTMLQTTCDCSGDYFGPHCEFEGGGYDYYVDDNSANQPDVPSVPKVLPVPKCTLECENEGTCVLGGSDDTYGVHDLDHLYDTNTGSAEDFMTCLCLPGFGGKLCEIEKTECGSHHCFHGGTCLTKMDTHGVTKNHCDCSTALESGHLYAGRFCQFKSNEFCSKKANENGQIFCVNGGECLDDDTDGCSCPPDYYGLSCEFMREPANFTAPQNLDGIANPEPLDVSHFTPSAPQSQSNEGEPILKPAQAACSLQCLNEGVCSKGAKDLGIINHLSNVEEISQSYNEDFEHCVCKDGYVGLQCEHEVEICPSGTHVCLYGSKCVKFGNVDGCDCSESNDFNLAGESCEHKSSRPGETICTKGDVGVVTPRSFCLNGGSCNAYVSAHEAHAGCSCIGKWSGPHCELKRNNNNAVVRPPTGKAAPVVNSNAATNSILAIGIVALMISLVVSLYTCRRNRKFKQELVRREYSMQRQAMERAAPPAPPRRRSMELPYKDEPPSHQAINQQPSHVNNLARGEPEVDIGPPRDEDCHELHNVII